MIADKLATYLDGAVTFPIFVEHLPDTPDSCIGIYSRGGSAADVSTTVARPQLQVLVRGDDADPRTAQAEAAIIQAALHGLHDTTFDTTRIMLCQCAQSEPVAVGTDDNGRYQYSINLNLITGGT